MLSVTHPERLARREARRPLWMDGGMVDGWMEVPKVSVADGC